MDVIKKLDICLGHLHDLIVSFEEVKESKELTDDFFSDNLEHLEQIKEIIVELERLEEPEVSLVEIEEEMKESAPILLEDKIAKTIFPNFRKALSLNDRFRFQRDLFGGDDTVMEQTIDTIDASQTYKEATDYLKNRFNWDWDSDSVVAFDELLRKRFA